MAQAIFNWLLILFFWIGGYGAISDHYRSIEGKRYCETIDEIDFIYLINLDQRPERWFECLRQLTPYGIFPHRFPGIYGWNLDVNIINEMGLKFQHGMWTGKEYVMIFPPDQKGAWDFIYLNGACYGKTCFSGWTVKGTLGCTLSHLSILKDALDADYQTIWVLEDDIRVMQNPHQLTELIQELNLLVGADGWDVLYTDFDYLVANSEPDLSEQFSWLWRPDMYLRDFSFMSLHIPLNKRFVKIGSRNRAHSIIYSRSGIEKIMNFYNAHDNFLAYDTEMPLIPGIRLYAVTQPIVSVSEALSDTRCRYFSTAN